MKRLLIPACVLLLLAWHLTRAASFIDEIEGVYVEKGNAMDKECPDCDFKPMKDATNCVVIKKESDKIARVYLNYVGENSNGCYIDSEYNFEIRKDSLFYRDEITQDEPQSQATDGIYVFKDKDDIAFKVQPISLDGYYCGVGQYINGYTISRSLKRVPWKNGGPDKPLNKLDRYCPAFNWVN